MHAKQTMRITAASAMLLAFAVILHFTGWRDARQIILIMSTILAGMPIAIKAFKAIRMKAFSIELLVTIAVIGALFIGEYVESAAVTFLFLFGAMLEIRTMEKTRSSLKALTDLAPLEAHVVRDGKTFIVPVDDIEIGDRVVIRSGEKVSVDGPIISGNATLNEAAITGESVPASKMPDDQVFSGTIVEQGYIEVIAARVGDDTTFARIIELVEEAQESKSKTEKFLERFANIYTPSIVVLSVLVYLFTRNMEMTLTFLVIACPGALVISAPVSIVAGIGNGARNGVLVKGGEVMEQLAKIDTVVFDKTGTLTKGRPEVTDVCGWGIENKELLRLTAEAEMISEHHLGQTIVKEAKKRAIRLVNQPEDAEVVRGNGILSTIEGKRLAAGNRKLMEAQGISIPFDVEEYALKREKAGNTAIFVSISREIAGIISIADQIRPEAAEALAKLRKNGISQMIMLTGDNRHTAQLVGEQLGLDAVYAELLPEDKVAAVQRLKEQGHHVAMAGDGINDAPAIATADIGLAMGEGGTDISMETADIVLMADRLDQFSHAYALAKTTVRNMKQNTFFAVGTVFLLLLGVLLGKVFLSSGMLVHEVSVLLVILNAIRLIRYTSDKPMKQNKSEVIPNEPRITL
ncbi:MULTISPECIES: cation-translocating P-type ATPase [unclassified Sporosarcina]|uniref:heavy metal translocating P-type ATPase n=1 Tax=unclassified Sporosarcina TaxID=2647733 RepID=UPI00203F9CF7|nr:MULTISPECIES: cation-translocating P-type ATPase [unclassified Sporosarcina]GKV64429.1 haloacid dehalogenase [Sporosarcina sp. NCCP-2331]GLB55174.1 haloacid dehalogenase [Sporosarcina sp. NCCP-2378]